LEKIVEAKACIVKEQGFSNIATTFCSRENDFVIHGSGLFTGWGGGFFKIIPSPVKWEC
jgi:hypothetical protein